MANFYLCKVAVMTRVSDGFVRFMSQADRITHVEWELSVEGEVLRTVYEQVGKYPNMNREYVYSVLNPSATNPPTHVLIRTEGTLEAGDFQYDMTNRTNAAWQAMYNTYPGIRAYPFADAPFQPA